MTNAPDRFFTWRWEQDPDEMDDMTESFGQQTIAGIPTGRPQRVTYSKDSKRPNAGTFVFAKEDHTLGNLLRIQLLRDPSIRYAGYRIPHPLIFDCHVRIETTTSQLTPVQGLDSALQDLQLETEHLDRAFEVVHNRNQFYIQSCSLRFVFVGCNQGV